MGVIYADYPMTNTEGRHERKNKETKQNKSDLLTFDNSTNRTMHLWIFERYSKKAEPTVSNAKGNLSECWS